MSCRTTPAGSAFTSYARLANGSTLSDVATLSTFHHLRSTYLARDEATRRQYTDAEYRDLLARQRERTERNTALTEPRRASILARLDAAAAGDLPDQGTLYSLFNLNPTIRNRGRALTTFLNQISHQLALPAADMPAVFAALENGIDRTRGAGDPDTYTEENIARSRELGLGDEAGTVHAVATLEARVQRHRADVVLAGPQRIIRTAVTNPDSHDGLAVTGYGYDARNGRLEVVVRDDATGTSSEHFYRNVDATAFETATRTGDNSALTRFWANEVRGNTSWAYSSRLAADLDSGAPRCAVCGQFANNAHGCPPIAEPRRLRTDTTTSRWSRQQQTISGFNRAGAPISQAFSVSLPAIRELRETFAAAPATIAINESASMYDENGGWSYLALRGEVTVYRDADGAIAFNTSALRCTCGRFAADGRCAHTDAVVTSVRTRLVPPVRTPAARLTPEERTARLAEAQRLAEEAAVTDWTRNEETLAEARRTWQTGAEVTYSTDFAAFEEVYAETVAARAAANGGTVVPYLRENALGGMATRESGQAFGMEIEYEFPPSMGYAERDAAQRLIGRELHAAGLAQSPSQEGYGASKRRGFRDTHTNADGTSNWSWERDGSVNGGELVTPGMYDEPETWTRLETAVEILRRNGAVPTKKAGAHVHVGTAMYQGDPTKYAELARLMVQHEDVMLRLAAEPQRGTHRNSHYSSPLREVPVDGFLDVGHARAWQGGRTRVLNFMGVNSPVTTISRDARGRETEVTDRSYLRDHPEFRIFDSTLHAGTMQAQVKLAVAMTHAAARNAANGGTARGKEVGGSHAQRAKARGRRQLSSAELAEDTATFRSLLDTLFTRKVDKDQLISVFAHTKWLANPQRG